MLVSGRLQIDRREAGRGAELAAIPHEEHVHRTHTLSKARLTRVSSRPA